jgi:ribosomal protein L11 methyltransferase
MKAKTSYYVRVKLPAGTGLDTREALSEIMTRVASRFSFQGLEDWAITLGAGEKVLGAEREFHDLRGKGTVSDEMRVYFGKKADGTTFGKLLSSVIPELKIGAPRELGKKDWMKEWRKHYRTQVVKEGKGALAIVPAWKKPPARPAAHVKIWPGQAFGTGTHATTRLCLRAYLRAAPDLGNKLSLLDFGAGTGVLALGALALAAKEGRAISALAVESDPEALAQAGKNARLNRRKLALRRKLAKGKRYDFVFANVLAPVLLAFRRELAAALKPGATIVLSGILASEAESFAEEFRQKGLELVRLDTEGDWASIEWRRPA